MLYTVQNRLIASSCTDACCIRDRSTPLLSSFVCRARTGSCQTSQKHSCPLSPGRIQRHPPHSFVSVARRPWRPGRSKSAPSTGLWTDLTRSAAPRGADPKAAGLAPRTLAEATQLQSEARNVYALQVEVGCRHGSIESVLRKIYFGRPDSVGLLTWHWNPRSDQPASLVPQSPTFPCTIQSKFGQSLHVTRAAGRGHHSAAGHS